MRARVGRLTIRWQGSGRSWLNVVRAFRGPKPLAQVHLHSWFYLTCIEPPPHYFRQCRACGAREQSDEKSPTRDSWYRSKAAE